MFYCICLPHIIFPPQQFCREPTSFYQPTSQSPSFHQPHHTLHGGNRVRLDCHSKLPQQFSPPMLSAPWTNHFRDNHAAGQTIHTHSRNLQPFNFCLNNFHTPLPDLQSYRPLIFHPQKSHLPTAAIPPRTSQPQTFRLNSLLRILFIRVSQQQILHSNYNPFLEVVLPWVAKQHSTFTKRIHNSIF